MNQVTRPERRNFPMSLKKSLSSILATPRLIDGLSVAQNLSSPRAVMRSTRLGILCDSAIQGCREMFDSPIASPSIRLGKLFLVPVFPGKQIPIPNVQLIESHLKVNQGNGRLIDVDVLINFGVIGLLEKFPNLFRRVVVLGGVEHEVTDHFPTMGDCIAVQGCPKPTCIVDVLLISIRVSEHLL